MSQENVELVRKDHSRLEPGRPRWQDFTRFWRVIHDPWEELRIDIERIEDGDDCLALEFRFRARGIGSGAPVDLKFSNAITFRDGLQTRIVARRVFDDARKAAGLLA